MAFFTASPDSDRPARPARFGLIFGALLLTGFGIVLTPPVQSAGASLSRGLVKVSHTLIQLCGGHAVREGAILHSASGFAVEMREGCNAINVTIFLWAAVLAFPAPWKWKLLGILAGTLMIQAINIVRFISLYYLGQYNMVWFDFAHNYLWESLIVMDTMVVFWLWVNQVLQRRPTHAIA